MGWLLYNYHALILSPEPWVSEKWNKAREDANDWIRRDEKITEEERWDMMSIEQQEELEKYYPEGMFRAKELDQKGV